MNLRFCMYRKPKGHPQHIMRDLGVAYQHSTPQSIGDCWWFWNCTGLPDELPDYLTELKVKPEDAIGYGLSKEMADKIIKGSIDA